MADEVNIGDIVTEEEVNIGKIKTDTVASGGTSNYEELNNKPSINSVELVGNKTLEELGIEIPTKTSDLINDNGYITKDVESLTNYYLKTEVDTQISNAIGGALNGTY